MKYDLKLRRNNTSNIQKPGRKYINFNKIKPLVDENNRIADKKKQKKLDQKLIYLLSYGGKEDVKKVKELLSLGADANAKDGAWTALMTAANYRYTETCKVLLHYGADIEIHDDEREMTALMMAARAGAAETCKLLISYGADIDEVEKNGWTAFVFAAIGNHGSVIDVLISEKANAVIKDNEGRGISLIMTGYSVYTSSLYYKIIAYEKLCMRNGMTNLKLPRILPHILRREIKKNVHQCLPENVKEIIMTL